MRPDCCKRKSISPQKPPYRGSVRSQPVPMVPFLPRWGFRGWVKLPLAIRTGSLSWRWELAGLPPKLKIVPNRDRNFGNISNPEPPASSMSLTKNSSNRQKRNSSNTAKKDWWRSSIISIASKAVRSPGAAASRSIYLSIAASSCASSTATLFIPCPCLCCFPTTSAASPVASGSIPKCCRWFPWKPAMAANVPKGWSSCDRWHWRAPFPTIPPKRVWHVSRKFSIDPKPSIACAVPVGVTCGNFCDCSTTGLKKIVSFPYRLRVWRR